MDEREMEAVESLFALPRPRTIQPVMKDGKPKYANYNRVSCEQMGALLKSAAVVLCVRFIPLRPLMRDFLIQLSYIYAITVVVLVLLGVWAMAKGRRQDQFLARFGVLTTATVTKHWLRPEGVAYVFRVLYEYYDVSGRRYVGGAASSDGSLQYKTVGTKLYLVYDEKNPRNRMLYDQLQYEVLPE